MAVSQVHIDIDLRGAEEGSVVTRFPPEPSGYLHIGHAKAALLNQAGAQKYKGIMILRFDDTNPSKEKMEFEESIKEDLAMLKIHPDRTSYTSDYFDRLYDYAIQLIKKGLAYVDDTDVATMRAERMDGIDSKCRDLSVEDNLKRFQEMKEGTESGQKCCLRAKINMQDPNKALRDPVLYRCNLLPHNRTGNKWKFYPTYDLACPVVDSLEGVTHAMRTNEYRDRNPQYEWVLNALGLRKVIIQDFSRMNFVYTLLSKRKLQWFVNEKHVSGWDDPRFPTVRGILRRGMTVDALKQYVSSQGASSKDVMLEWDQLWAINKQMIDKVAPRHTSIPVENVVKVNILGGEGLPYVKEMPKHKKNPDVGMKKTAYSSQILVDQADTQTFESGEEITLMDWGNAFIKTVTRSEDDPSIVTSVDLELHLAGDFKKTKKKITWLANTDNIVRVVHVDYDYLITKRKLEEEDDVKNFVTPKSEFTAEAYADANVRDLTRGDIIQFERVGFFIVDSDLSSMDTPPRFIKIPDGKASTMASKAGAKDASSAADNRKSKPNKQEAQEANKAKKAEKKAERAAKKAAAKEKAKQGT